DFDGAFLGIHLNRPLLGQKVFDLLTVIESATGFADLKNVAGIEVVGIGSAGPVALHAAALDPRIKRVTLEQSLVSWSAVAQTPISYNQLTNVVPGALKAYDLPDLAAMIAPRPLTIRGAVDPALKPVTKAALDEAYARCKEAYAKQKADKQLALPA